MKNRNVKFNKSWLWENGYKTIVWSSLWCWLSTACWNPKCKLNEEVVPKTPTTPTQPSHTVQTYNKSISISNFLFGLSFPNDSIGYVVGSSGAVYKTIDSTNSFFALSSPTTEHLFDTYFMDSQNGFIAGNNLAFYKTSNGGSSWSSISVPVSSVNFRRLGYRNSSLMFALGGDVSTNSIMLKSTDGGNSWSNITLSGAHTVYGIDFISDDTLLVSGHNAEVFLSTNQGSSWSQMNVNTGSSSIYPLILADIKMVNSHVGYIVGFASPGYDDRFVLKTINGGFDWTRVDLNLIQGSSDVYTDIKVLPSNEIVVTGGSVNDNTGLIIRSKDGGVTWMYDSIPPSIPRLYRSTTINDVEYFAGNTGTVLKRY